MGGGGGKSSSSTSSSSSKVTTTSSATATANVAPVIQGQTITVNQDLPDAAVDVFKQLVALSGKAVDVAAGAGKTAIEALAANQKASLESTQNLAQATKQPDLTVVAGYQKQVYYAIGAVALVAVYLIVRKK